MARTYFEIIFLWGIVLQIILLWPYLLDLITKKQPDYFSKRERLLLLYAFTGFMLLPLIYVFTTWFSFFDYNLPTLIGFLAALLYFFGIWLLFKAYRELGPNWSPGPEIREGHILIITGVFKWVRHPIYAAYASMAVAQIFMLQNWFVGPAFLLLATPFYRYRVQLEEQYLTRYFGDQYLAYRKQTNALYPKTEQIDFRMILERIKSFKKRR